MSADNGNEFDEADCRKNEYKKQSNPEPRSESDECGKYVEVTVYCKEMPSLLTLDHNDTICVAIEKVCELGVKERLEIKRTVKSGSDYEHEDEAFSTEAEEYANCDAESISVLAVIISDVTVFCHGTEKREDETAIMGGKNSDKTDIIDGKNSYNNSKTDSVGGTVCDVTAIICGKGCVDTVSMDSKVLSEAAIVCGKKLKYDVTVNLCGKKEIVPTIGSSGKSKKV